MENPLDLPAVLKFGALLSIVMAMSKLATALAGKAGVLTVAFLSGLVDLDAIALAMARHGVDEVGYETAAGAILIALGANTLVKMVMSWGIGGAVMGLRFSLVSALAIGSGLGCYLMAPALLPW